MTSDIQLAQALAIGFLSFAVWLFADFQAAYYEVKNDKRESRRTV